MKQSFQTEGYPAIKRGWLRSILFLITANVVSVITTAIGLFVIIKLFNYEFDLSLIFEEPNTLMEYLGPFSMTVIAFSQFIGMFFILWIFRKYIDKKSIESLGLQFKQFKHDFILGLLFGAVSILFGFVIIYLIGYITIIEIQFTVLNLLNYFFLFALVALYEEIMIRGYMLNNFMSSMNKYVALIVSSLCFMIMHLINPNISILAIINLFIAGLLLGIYYIHKTNLWFPIGMHLTWNFFQGPVFGFEVSGIRTTSIITQEIQGNPIITGGEFGFEGSIISTIIGIIMIVIIHKMAKRT